MIAEAIDLALFEGARDELRDAVIDILDVAFTCSIGMAADREKDKLMGAMLQLGNVHSVIERAIEAVGEPAEQGANDG